MSRVGILAGAATAALALALAGCATPAASGSGDPAGTWGTPDVRGKPSLELKDDQSVTGSDGCNRLVGTWKKTGETIEFGPFASTRMACEGVDTWLSGAASATVSGETMAVQNKRGKEIGTLERAR